MLSTLARWLSGMRPASGRSHYFSRVLDEDCVSRLASPAARGGGSLACPFCGRRFRMVANLYTHILREHEEQVEEIARACRRRVQR